MPIETLISMIPSLIAPDMPPMAAKELAQQLGRNENAVRVLLTKMHKRGEVYISERRRSPRGRFADLFTFGPGEDVPPLVPLSNAESCKRYAATKYGGRIKKKVARTWYKKNNGAEMRNIKRNHAKALKAYELGGVAAIDPLLAAIMGIK